MVDGRLLVTPEGVVLDIETAGLASRVLARALDLVIVVTAAYVVLFAAAMASPSLWVLVIVVVIVLFLGVFVYPAVLEALWDGRTVGKAAVGLRVLADDGGPVRFRHTAIRSMLGIVDLLVTSGFAGIVAILLSARGQRMGDLAAGTIVVRERGVDKHPVLVAPLPPPGYEAFVSSLDVRNLTSADRSISRAVLSRQHDLSLEDSERLLARTAVHMEARMGGRRPTMMNAALFVACVAAAEPPTQTMESSAGSPGAGPSTTPATWSGDLPSIPASDPVPPE